jgi:hypothetical protein
MGKLFRIFQEEFDVNNTGHLWELVGVLNRLLFPLADVLPHGWRLNIPKKLDDPMYLIFSAELTQEEENTFQIIYKDVLALEYYCSSKKILGKPGKNIVTVVIPQADTANVNVKALRVHNEEELPVVAVAMDIDDNTDDSDDVPLLEAPVGVLMAISPTVVDINATDINAMDILNAPEPGPVFPSSSEEEVEEEESEEEDDASLSPSPALP